MVPRSRRRCKRRASRSAIIRNRSSFPRLAAGSRIAAPDKDPIGTDVPRIGSWQKLVTPRGVLQTGGFPASSTGPRLNDLVLGSEGVFGIITEATVRLHAAPAASE